MNLGPLLQVYFKPKDFEFYGERPVYELVGIKAYKKYLPTTGDIARQRRKITQINIGIAGKTEELYRYERKTRNYEWRHLLGALIFVLLVVVIDKKLTTFDWIFLAGLNLYVNMYPVMLQRYNRIRIIRVLQNNGHPSPYNHKSQ